MRTPVSRSRTLTPPVTPATATMAWPTPSHVSTHVACGVQAPVSSDSCLESGHRLMFNKITKNSIMSN